MFSEACILLPDERTPTFIQLAFSGCVLLPCRFVAVRSFFEGAVLAKPSSPSLIVAPPIFSRGLWLLLPCSPVYTMFGSLPFFVFCLEIQKKRRCTVVACLQAGSRLSPQIPSESNQCLRRLFREIYPPSLHVFTVPLPNRSR